MSLKLEKEVMSVHDRQEDGCKVSTAKSLPGDQAVEQMVVSMNKELVLEPWRLERARTCICSAT